MLKVLALIVLSLTAALSQDGIYPRYNYLTKHDESPKPYEFEYVAEAIEGVSTRKEVADGTGRVVGSYTLKEDDGRSRVVEYVADDLGFRAVVKTNEPGTSNENPANVEMYSSLPNEYQYRHPVSVVEKPPVRVVEKPPVRVEQPKPVVEEKPRVFVPSPYRRPYRPQPYRRPPPPFYY